MRMRGHIDHDRFIVLQRMRNEIFIKLNELSRRSAEAHGMRQVVDFHGEWNGDELA